MLLWSESTGFYVTSKKGWRGWPLLGGWLGDSGIVRSEMLMKEGFYDVGGFDVVAAPGQTLYACWEDLPLATWRLLMVDRLGRSLSTVPFPRFALLKPYLGIARRPDLWVGKEGRLHVSFVGATREEGGLLKPRNLLRYAERDPDTGRWSEPLLVWSDSSTSASPSQVVVGADGLRHLVWFRASEDSWRGTLLHSWSGDGLVWSTAVEVAPGPEWLCDGNFSVVPDYAGRLHAVWAGSKNRGTTYSYAWWQDGAWRPPLRILSGDSTRGPGVYGFCTGPDSCLHLVWVEVTRPPDLWHPLPGTMLHSVLDLRTLTSNVEAPPSATASAHLAVRAYPNPFNESVVFKVPPAGSRSLTLALFDLQGRLVRSLCLEVSSASEIVFRWDGKDERGEPVPSGVYYYQVSGSHGEQKRMVQARGKVLLVR
ncbi:MAG: T9SS type A sorting domain-containing protein [candidate division KSB1 bacterium]|nr:T9SS type A sorting domain-containing protein [candidate division KSB1 bacterium]